jgi:hypothetical protein
VDVWFGLGAPSLLVLLWCTSVCASFKVDPKRPPHPPSPNPQPLPPCTPPPPPTPTHSAVCAVHAVHFSCRTPLSMQATAAPVPAAGAGAGAGAELLRVSPSHSSAVLVSLRELGGVGRGQTGVWCV